jgi:GNAT superfamily N-acetyltransferase
MHFQRACALPKAEWLATRAERGTRNRRQKKALVDRNAAHGIIVYTDGSPAGWCQYGPRSELPRFDGDRRYKSITPVPPNDKLWRIPCFVVEKSRRGKGVAAAALDAALKSIAAQGGGIVEAFPLRDWKEIRTDELQRVGRTPSFGNSSTHGTLRMLQRQGFEIVANYGPRNVLVRKFVPAYHKR